MAESDLMVKVIQNHLKGITGLGERLERSSGKGSGSISSISSPGGTAEKAGDRMNMG